MVKITKVYTRTGDDGETHLAAGLRVKKTNRRIVAIGAIDELNSLLGWSVESMRAEKKLTDLCNQVRRLQNELFDLGAQLSTLAAYRRDNTPIIHMKAVTRLEDEIDAMNECLPPLTSFILPGGGEASTRLHIARTVCRRAERDMWQLQEAEDAVEAVLLTYCNRLSDWLFVAARFVAMTLDEQEVLWEH